MASLLVVALGTTLALSVGCTTSSSGQGGGGAGTTSTTKTTGAQPTTGASPVTGPGPTTGSNLPTTVTTGSSMNDCVTYCNAIMTNCTAANSQYASDAECMTACSAFAPGTPGATSGDSLGCRIYHADAAASNPDVHCAHAGPDGGGVCVD